MLQYIHKGHQGKERCLLQGRNTVFWPKMTCDVQELRKVHHMPGTWEITANHWYYSGTSPFPMAHIGDRHILLEKNGLSNSSRRLLKILTSEEIGKFYICSHLCRTSHHCNRIRPTPIIRSDNGPCYNSKEFQQFLQQYNITHQTSSPYHPRSNRFVERMVRVAKKLMDKAGREGKLDLRSV